MLYDGLSSHHRATCSYGSFVAFSGQPWMAGGFLALGAIGKTRKPSAAWASAWSRIVSLATGSSSAAAPASAEVQNSRQVRR